MRMTFLRPIIEFFWRREKWSPTAINTTMISCESTPMPGVPHHMSENEKPASSGTDKPLVAQNSQGSQIWIAAGRLP